MDSIAQTSNNNISRFQVETVDTDDDLLDVGFETQSWGKFSSSQSMGSCPDDVVSVGNTSMFSQITADVISGVGNALPMISAPGSVLGSSILLASRSYLDVYQEVSSQHSAANQITTIEEEETADVFDNSEYIDTLEGRLPLTKAARMIAKDSSKHSSLFAKRHIRKVRIDCYKRLLTIGFSFLLLFSSSFSIRNVLNSLGKDRQLSLICYGAMFSFLWFGGACANPIVSKLRPKWSLVLATSGFIIYPLAMFYKTYFTTLPASVYAGFCIGLWWAVEGIYVINTASTYALVSGEELIHVVGRFNGIVFCFFLSSHIFGNFLSSLLLGDFYTLPTFTDDSPAVNVSYEHEMKGNDTKWVCGIDFYEFSDRPKAIKQVQIGKQYIYLAVNTLLPSIACLLLVLCLRKLKVARKPGSASLLLTLKLLLGMFKDARILLLLPLLVSIGMMTSLMIADFTAAYISCSYGVENLGYFIMIAFSFSAVGAFASGRLVQAVGRAPIIITSSLTLISSAVCMLLWKPPDNKVEPMAFVIPCLWALAEGVLGTQVNSLASVMFQKKLALAVTVVTSFLSVGTLVGTFTMAFSLFTLTTKVYLVISLNSIAMISFIILELLLKKNIL